MRDLATRLFHPPLLPGTRRVYIVRYYCVTVLVHGGISLSLDLVWTSTSRCDVSMGWVWLGSSLKCSWIPLPLSLSLENAQRMFDGFTGEEIWSGAVLRRGYTKGVMDACFREQAVGSGESELSNAIWRGNKILGRLDSLLRKFLGSRLDFWKFLSLKNANNSGWTRGGRILNFAMDVRGVVGWFIEN